VRPSVLLPAPLICSREAPHSNGQSFSIIAARANLLEPMAASIPARGVLFLASACVLLWFQGADAAHAHTLSAPRCRPPPAFPHTAAALGTYTPRACGLMFFRRRCSSSGGYSQTRNIALPLALGRGVAERAALSRACRYTLTPSVAALTSAVTSVTVTVTGACNDTDLLALFCFDGAPSPPPCLRAL
jgi:hypothetical protein